MELRAFRLIDLADRKWFREAELVDVDWALNRERLFGRLRS
jgi:hypothetical protein